MKTKAFLSVVTLALLTLGMGVANAEPVKMTSQDLDKVSAGTYGGYYYYYRPLNTASAGAHAEAYGFNTDARAFSDTFTRPGFSGASSSSSSYSH